MHGYRIRTTTHNTRDHHLRPDLRASNVVESPSITNGEIVPHNEQTRLHFYTPGGRKRGRISVTRNVRYNITDVYVFVRQ